MASGESMMEYPFKWGDTVEVLTREKPCMGSVCGFRVIDSREVADEFSALIGDVLVLVEFGDGSSLEFVASDLKSLEGGQQ
jgi:hypothetical protein